MSAVPLRKPDVVAELVVAVRALTAAVERATTEIRAMRAEQRRRSPAAVPMLIAALEEQFGATSRFTVRSVLDVVDEDPHGALAEAVAQVLNMNASAGSRAVTLGALLTRLPEIEVVAEQRGASLYRLRREYMCS